MIKLYINQKSKEKIAMRDNKVKKLVFAALLAALACVATMIIQVPSPMNGYVNMGDCVVLLSGWLLGPAYGAAATAVGSCLADVFTGYAYYAPATFIIKGVMALVAALVYRAGKGSFAARLSGSIAAELIMVAGYFGFASLLLGKGLAAAASIPGNLVQGLFGIVAAQVIMAVCVKAKLPARI